MLNWAIIGFLMFFHSQWIEWRYASPYLLNRLPHWSHSYSHMMWFLLKCCMDLAGHGSTPKQLQLLFSSTMWVACMCSRTRCVLSVIKPHSRHCQTCWISFWDYMYIKVFQSSTYTSRIRHFKYRIVKNYSIFVCLNSVDWSVCFEPFPWIDAIFCRPLLYLPIVQRESVLNDEVFSRGWLLDV